MLTRDDRRVALSATHCCPPHCTADSIVALSKIRRLLIAPSSRFFVLPCRALVPSPLAPLFPRPLDPRAVLPSLVASAEHGAGRSPLPACLAFLCCLLTADTAGLTAACLEVSVVRGLLFIGLLDCLSSGLAPVSVCLHVLALCLCVLPASCLSVWLLQCQFVTGLRWSLSFFWLCRRLLSAACRLLRSVFPGFMCRFLAADMCCDSCCK
jgi:hypothetical protein